MQANELLKLAVQKMQAAGIDNAQLDARVLLQFASGKSREFFLAHPEAEIDSSNFMELVERRVKREPISHITGKKEFYGREFIVSADVLTPRPETELIINAAKQYFQPFENLKILELGVGSGCIITTLLLEFPKSTGIGVDISNNALAIARQNAYKLGVQGLEFYCSDWTEKIEPQKFDLVVSNPPYIRSAEAKKLEAELGFEPEIALYAGNSGLDAYEKIARGLKKISFRYAMFEIGQGQEDEVRQIFYDNDLELVEAKKDLAGIIRTLIFRPKL
jgi:release factor glutamine methyltransferase